jgi:hypothetical protein
MQRVDKAVAKMFKKYPSSRLLVAPAAARLSLLTIPTPALEGQYVCDFAPTPRFLSGGIGPPVFPQEAKSND